MVIFHSYVSLPEGTPYHLKKSGVSGTCGTLSNPAKQCVTISPSHPTGPWHVQRVQRVQRVQHHQASLWICVGTSLSQVLDEMMAASKLSEAHKNASTNMGLIWIKGMEHDGRKNISKAVQEWDWLHWLDWSQISCVEPATSGTIILQVNVHLHQDPPSTYKNIHTHHTYTQYFGTFTQTCAYLDTLSQHLRCYPIFDGSNPRPKPSSCVGPALEKRAYYIRGPYSVVFVSLIMLHV